jgi:hypothetical protein
MALLRNIQRKARIPHKCWFCGETILPGEKYSFRSGNDESGNGKRSGMWHFCAHNECAEAADEGFSIYDWESFSPGSMQRGICEAQ